MAKAFEDHLKELEEAVQILESGEESLERSLAVFEEAVKHLKACQDLLAKAEKRVRILAPQEDGTVGESDFAPPEE